MLEEQVTAPATAVETPAPVQPDTVESGTTDPAVPVAEESDEQKNERLLREREERSQRAKSGIQRRFDEMTAEKRAALRTAEELAEQNRLLREQLQQRSAPQETGPQEPRRDQFSTYEEFLDARAEWKAEQRVAAILKADREAADKQAAQQRVAQQAQEIGEKFSKAQAEFIKANPDYEEVVLGNNEVQLPNEAIALIPVIPDGHIAAYAIGKNPELAQQLWGKSIPQQAAILGRIAATFQAKPSPQVSKAPEPGQPVNGRGGVTPKRIEDMTRDEYYDHITKSRRKSK